MVAHFLEASVNFQTGDVMGLYALVFGVLAVIAVVTYVSAINKQK